MKKSVSYMEREIYSYFHVSDINVLYYCLCEYVCMYAFIYLFLFIYSLLLAPLLYNSNTTSLVPNVFITLLLTLRYFTIVLLRA
jgi:hypothetical protein